MKVYTVVCIDDYGDCTTMATCDSEDTAAKWIKERMPSGYCFIIPTSIILSGKLYLKPGK